MESPEYTFIGLGRENALLLIMLILIKKKEKKNVYHKVNIHFFFLF